MAGFLGMFNYSKPGPGVSKNAPKKKSFIIFFEIYFRKFWKLVTANLLYCLVTLPVVTNGLADAGLAYITRNFAREKHAFVAGDFFDTIKKNWKQALPIGLVNVILTLLIGFDIWFFYGSTTPTEDGESAGWVTYLLFGLVMCVGLIFTLMKYYIPMLIITFKLTAKQIYKDSFILAIAGLWRNLLIFIILLAFYALGIVLFIFVDLAISLPILIFVYLLVFPAFRSYLIQYTIFPVVKKHLIDPYYKEHPEEGKKARENLNIAVENNDPVTEEDEPVFTDMGAEESAPEEEKKPLNIPKQYTEKELRRRKRYTRDNAGGDDDDGTI